MLDEDSRHQVKCMQGLENLEGYLINRSEFVLDAERLLTAHLIPSLKTSVSGSNILSGHGAEHSGCWDMEQNTVDA